MPNLLEIIFGSSNRSESRNIQLRLEKGELRKISSRIYSTNLTDEPDVIILRNWYIILSHFYPEAILSHRSAIEGRPTQNQIYLTYKTSRKIELPGLTIHLLNGPDKEFGTIHFFESLYRSSEARAYLENMERSRSNGQISKTLPRIELENKLEAIIRTRGEQELNRIRDEAKEISKTLGMESEFEQLSKLISALLSTRPTQLLNSEVTKARAFGEPFDPARVDIFAQLYEQLSNMELENYIDLNTTGVSYSNFAFFESYFSNFIEGTEFTIKEARQIIETRTPIPARDEDSHDILGTYQIVSNKKEMQTLATSADHLLYLLRTRHAIILNARINKNPGQFKQINNRAGETIFVDWTLVTGTLKKGYQYYSLLKNPFAKACYLMFLISEVHPFLDGNGRIARIMMNAELTAAGMSKIIIPTVYRIDYIDAIRKLTRKGDAITYIRMLRRAYLFSSTLHGESLEELENYLINCNAFKEEEQYMLRF